jgi:hypothetical protein
MTLRNRLLYAITARLPARLIKIDDRPYLERYYVGELAGVTFYLHRFVSGDSERHLHNHPWWRSGSLILAGSYLEERVVDLCPHASESGCIIESSRVRWFNVIAGNLFHRISDAAPGTWSLFFHGERAYVLDQPKGWGFLAGEDGLTVFRPMPPSTPYWWRTAPLGRDVGRVAL